MLCRSLFFALAATTVASADNGGEVNKKHQCQGIPSALFDACRKSVAEGKPFFYSYIRTPQGCATLTDSTAREACLDDVADGNRHPVQTATYMPESIDPAPRPTTEEAPQSARLERIAKASERTALVATIQLVLLAAGTVVAVALTLLR